MSSEDRLNRILQLNAQAKEELSTQPEEPDTHEKEVILETPTSDEQRETLTKANPGAEVESTEASSGKLDQEQDATKITNGDDETPADSDAKSSLHGSPVCNVDSQEEQESSSPNKEHEEQQDIHKTITKSSSPTLTRRTKAKTTTETQELSHESLPTLTQDSKTSKRKTQTNAGQHQLVSVREVVCMVFAVLMRGMLAYGWFVQAAGQVREKTNQDMTGVCDLSH